MELYRTVPLPPPPPPMGKNILTPMKTEHIDDYVPTEGGQVGGMETIGEQFSRPLPDTRQASPVVAGRILRDKSNGGRVGNVIARGEGGRGR